MENKYLDLLTDGLNKKKKVSRYASILNSIDETKVTKFKPDYNKIVKDLLNERKYHD